VTGPGQLFSLGDNSYGQLGDGTFNDQLAPQKVPGMTAVESVHAGRGHVLGLRSNGTVWAWGWNKYGQVGNGSSATNVTSPAQVLSGVIEVGAGHSHSPAIKSDGTVWAWGYNQYGQLGDRTPRPGRSRSRSRT
jgi:YD repeat-containing protein